MRILFSCLLASVLMGSAVAQSQQPRDNPPPPRSSDDGVSSSNSTRINLAPPRGDAKEHPNSGVADEVLEMYTYDPHRAAKDVEVGDYYFNDKNYKAAVSRYRSALRWKPKDAFATFKLALALEKKGDLDEARTNYEEYLKILPEGDKAADCKKALERLPKEQAEQVRREDKEAKKRK